MRFADAVLLGTIIYRGPSCVERGRDGWPLWLAAGFSKWATVCEPVVGETDTTTKQEHYLEVDRAAPAEPCVIYSTLSSVSRIWRNKYNRKATAPLASVLRCATLRCLLFCVAPLSLPLGPLFPLGVLDLVVLEQPCKQTNRTKQGGGCAAGCGPDALGREADDVRAGDGGHEVHPAILRRTFVLLP